jgi:hypothetical protein
VLKAAVKATHKVLTDYFKKSMSTRHSFVAIICDPCYRLKYYEYLFKAQGGANSTQYKQGKEHFEYVFNDYNKRAVGIKEYKRQQAENVAIDACEVQEAAEGSPVQEVEGQQD